MSDKTLNLELGNLKINGFVHVGAGTGEYARYYHRLGVSQVMWLEATTGLYPMLYENTKSFGMDQRIFMENLGVEKTFKTVWREHAPFITNLDGHDALHIACKANQIKILDGFEDLFDIFQYVIISKHASENESEDDAVEEHLGKMGFALTSFSADYDQRLFVRA